MRFDLIPHWHLYWRNPGASGAAPTLRWTLPEGWTIGDLHWPVPKRIRVGPLTNYGYEDTVTLLVPVRIPETPLPTGPLILIADAEWLVCRVVGADCGGIHAPRSRGRSAPCRGDAPRRAADRRIR